MSCKVSVIIPVYGVEKWLDACLESVLGQEGVELEAVCVDDCSPDRCPQMLDEWARRDPRVRVLHLERNGGQGIARNRGMAVARGEYVYFLDSDDMVAPGALAHLVRVSDEERLDGVFFDMQCVFDTPEMRRLAGTHGERAYGTHPTGVVSGMELYRSLVRSRDWICYPQRWLWRRSFLEQSDVTFPAEYRHEDEFFSFKAVLEASRVIYLRERYFLRRYREGSVMTSRQDSLSLVSYLSCYVHMLDYLHSRGLDMEEAHQELARISYHMERIYVELTDRGEDAYAAARDTWLEPLLPVIEEELRGIRHSAAMGPKALAAIRESDTVYLYGAGIVARNVHEALCREKLAYDAFVVTSMEANSRAYLGHRVMSLDEAPLPAPGAVVIVSVSERAREEIEGLLDARCVEHVYYRE